MTPSEQALKALTEAIEFVKEGNVDSNTLKAGLDALEKMQEHLDEMENFLEQEFSQTEDKVIEELFQEQDYDPENTSLEEVWCDAFKAGAFAASEDILEKGTEIWKKIDSQHSDAIAAVNELWDANDCSEVVQPWIEVETDLELQLSMGGVA